MKNKMPRVLAYTLAKELTNDELSDVAGGSSQQQLWSAKPSAHVSGTNGAWDTSVDFVFDA